MTATASRGAGGRAPLVYLVAGEPSGDLLGAGLMAALRAETGGDVAFAGLGGEEMAAQGLDSLFPIRELGVMGLVEVLPHVLPVYRRIRQTAAAAAAARPDLLVTIDAPAFSLQVSRRSRGKGFPLVHYVAPSVWAWKAWRAREIAGFLDHLLALLPFEPPYFEEHGLATTFVGHPAVEARAAPGLAAAFRARHGLAGGPVLCVLPGSRRAEVRRLAPVFGETLRTLATRFPGLGVIVPTVAPVADLVRAATGAWPLPAVVLEGRDARLGAFAVADVALAASGTVAVELAAAGLPAVIAYRVNPVTAALVARLVRVDHVAIPSLVLGREVQPELLQGRCTPDRLAAAVAGLLDDPAARRAQRRGYEAALRRLGKGGPPPSRRAARCLLSLIGAGRAGAGAYNDRQAKRAPS